MTDSLAGDLREHIYQVALGTPHDKLSWHWVMSLEWFTECRRLADSSGRTLYEPGMKVTGPEYLLGMPVEIREDGGVPHLERNS